MRELTKNERLERLIEHYAEGKKAEFARRLGVSPQTINTWLGRSSFDVELVFAKCESVSGDWLLSGRGEMMRDKQATTSITAVPQPPPVAISEHDPRDIEKIKYLEDMLAITRDALHECKESKADKDARIADKDRMISDRDEIIKDCRKEKERSDQYTRRLEAENMQLKFSPGSKRTSGLPFDVGLGDAPVDEL